MPAAPGKVFLVGAGPGAADLLTLRAARLLAQADIVFHDALVHPDTLALAVHAELVAVGKRCGRHSSTQQFINSSLVEAAHRHACVVRLKGGDPLVFGRAQEEIDALKAAGIDYEVVPGVTAALGAAADLGVSLTRRGLSRSLALVTPRIGAAEAAGRGWIECARHADTLAIYMAREDATAIASALIAAGRAPSTPVIMVVNATLASQTQAIGTTLGALGAAAMEHLDGPAVILIGEVLAETVADLGGGGLAALDVRTGIQVRPCDPMDPAALALLRASDACMQALYPAESNHLIDPAALAQDQTLFLGAYNGARLVGCGAVRMMDDDGRYGEIKRIFVPPEARGRGAAKAILAMLERHMIDRGLRIARLETGIHQAEAIGLYSRLGFVERAPFGSYRPDPLSLFMEKRLDAPVP